MPSQRLLKMLDPRGHLPVLASPSRKAIVWASQRLRTWIARELDAAGIHPLLAVSVRHLACSMRSNARPQLSLAVLDVDVMTESDLEVIVAARWRGYNGPIIAISRCAALTSCLRTLLGIESVVVPEGRLREAVARAIAC